MLFGIRGVFLASCLVHDYFLEFLLGELFEAGALGQIASKEAVDLLVPSALVGGIGVCEAGANPELLDGCQVFSDAGPGIPWRLSSGRRGTPLACPSSARPPSLQGPPPST